MNTIRTTAIALGLFILLFAGLNVEAAEKSRLWPSDMDWLPSKDDEPRFYMMNATKRGNGGSEQRVAVRFDISRIKNVGSLKRVVLRVIGESGKPGAGSEMEARPITSDWGGLSTEFRKHEVQWQEALLGGTLHELAWEQRGKTGPKPDIHSGLRESRVFVGRTDWVWALYPVKRWKTPGGDLGSIAATGGDSLDLTDMVKAWSAKGQSNFGVMLSKKGGGTLDLQAAWLELEGDEVSVSNSPRIVHHPGWLPKTYNVKHPRLPYPTKEWLDKVKSVGLNKVKGLPGQDLGKVVKLILEQKLSPSEEGKRKLSAMLGGGKPIRYGSWTKPSPYALATLYDWGYDLLSEEDRMCLALRLLRVSKKTAMSYRLGPLNAPGNAVGPIQLWTALAIYPDIPGARNWLWQAKAYYINTCIPMWNLIMGEQGGMWHEWGAYYLARADRMMYQTLPIWSTATGEDLFGKNPFIEATIYPFFHAVRPDGIRIPFGDLHGPQNGGGMTRIATVASQRYRNPYGPGERDGITPTASPWGPPLPKDLAKKDKETLPLSWYTQGGMGFVFMRSDWSEDATYIWMKLGLTGRGHAHMDSGHFSIYKRAPLAVDSSNYDAGYKGEAAAYYRLTIAHNLVTVTDPAEKDLKIGWMKTTTKDGKYKYDGTIPNAGGQRWTSGTFASGAHMSRPGFEKKGNHYTGKVIAFHPDKNFTYVCGDVTRAYTDKDTGTGKKGTRSKRVRKYLRTLLYLPPNHLVVFDQVESFNPDFKKRWHLHTVHEPKVEGNLITVKHAETVFRNRYGSTGYRPYLKYATKTGKDHPFFKAHPDCKWHSGWQPQLYKYDGVMFMRALLPKTPEIVKVGGPGKEYWVNGKNYHMTSPEGGGGYPTPRGGSLTLQNQPHLATSENGSWRIEVSPKAARENDVFLNVIQVGISSENPQLTEAKLVEVKEGTGLEVALEDGRKALVVFKEGIGGHVKITGGGKPAVEADLAEKVLPNLPVEK